MTSENYTQEILDELNKFKKLHAQTATLRDQFAMAALTGLIASNCSLKNRKEAAEDAYLTADAILEARGENQ